MRAEPEEGDNVRSSPVSFQIVDRDIDGLVIRTAKGAGIAGVVVLENNKDRVIMDKLRQLSGRDLDSHRCGLTACLALVTDQSRLQLLDQRPECGLGVAYASTSAGRGL